MTKEVKYKIINEISKNRENFNFSVDRGKMCKNDIFELLVKLKCFNFNIRLCKEDKRFLIYK